jgi:hypothetical protein
MKCETRDSKFPNEKYRGPNWFFHWFWWKANFIPSLIVLSLVQRFDTCSKLLFFSFCFNTCVFDEETHVRSCGSEGKKNVYFFTKIQEQNIESLWDFIEDHLKLSRKAQRSCWIWKLSKLVHKWVQRPFSINA